MRLVTAVSWALTAAPVALHAAGCENPLSYDERRAVVAEEAKGDPVLFEAIALEHTKDADLSRPQGEPIRISWDQALKLILLGTVRTAVQHHDLSIALITRSGRQFTTRESRLGEIWKAVAIVDPCGVYITKVTE